ncbi:MAG: TonB-dependent receptor [Gammaproteobacteria bacterium]|nr:TonB-dependent receptor [Gammaproteobacteria bacterium]
MILNKPLLRVIVALLSAGVVTAQAQETADSSDIEEVIVRGIRAADMNAREAERMKDIFSSVISQDDVGNFADQNVAEALQRLPGVTLQKSDGQAEFVNIRGLGPSFVGVTMNNSELSSATDAGRAVGLNAIPADLMGAMEVFKSLTPDMDLNSIGGKVNVKSVSAFDKGKDTLKVSVQGSMHEQRGEFSPKTTVLGTKLLADDTIGIAASFSFEERSTDINQIDADTDDGLQYIRQSQPYVGRTDPTMLARPPALSSTQYMESGFVDPYIDSPRMLIPSDFEVIVDETVRTRIAGTLDFGWRPTDGHDYYFRYAHTDFNDEEVTLRENYRLINSTNFNYIISVDPANNFFALTNTDLRHQIQIEEYSAVTDDISIGGENIFNDWTIDYEYHQSESERNSPDDRRIQYRIRALPMYGQLYKEDIRGAIISGPSANQIATDAGAVFDSSLDGMSGFAAGFAEGVLGYGIGLRRQPNMRYDNIRLQTVLRTDDLSSLNFNVRKNFTDGGFFNANYIKAGIEIKERDRNNIETEHSVNPIDFSPSICNEDRDCLNNLNSSLGSSGFATFTPRFSRFDHDFITMSDAARLIVATRIIPESVDPERSGADSLKENYAVYENSTAAYLMGEFQFSDSISVIAGARYVQTEYGSTGWLTLKHDRFTQEDGILRDIAIPLGGTNGGYAINKYDGIYPGIHVRYDLRDDLLIRASLWTSFNRPDFDNANAYAEFDDRVVLCTDAPLPNEAACGDNLTDDLGATGDLDQYARDHFSLAPGGNALDVGNSELMPMQATHFDASLSWYGEGGHFAEVAVFYKDIEDFIVDVRGLDVYRSNMPLAIRQALDQIDVNVNGGADPNRNQNVFAIAPDFLFRDVSTTINGDKATLYGLEGSYARYFENGLFFSGNITLLDSSADAGATVRADDIPLPNQADVTTNITVGWENEKYSVRMISNYRSEVLREIGTCSQADIDADAAWASLNDASNPDALAGATGTGVRYAENCQRWADVFHDDIFSMDLKATYIPWENIKFYLDILNVTEDVDVFFYRGNEFSRGNVLQFTEGVGRTYQLGVNVSLW